MNRGEDDEAVNTSYTTDLGLWYQYWVHYWMMILSEGWEEEGRWWIGKWLGRLIGRIWC